MQIEMVSLYLLTTLAPVLRVGLAVESGLISLIGFLGRCLALGTFLDVILKLCKLNIEGSFSETMAKVIEKNIQQLLWVYFFLPTDLSEDGRQQRQKHEIHVKSWRRWISYALDIILPIFHVLFHQICDCLVGEEHFLSALRGSLMRRWVARSWH